MQLSLQLNTASRCHHTPTHWEQCVAFCRHSTALWPQHRGELCSAWDPSIHQSSSFSEDMKSVEDHTVQHSYTEWGVGIYFGNLWFCASCTCCGDPPGSVGENEKPVVWPRLKKVPFFFFKLSLPSICITINWHMKLSIIRFILI